jgi:putative glycosyltransferase (TIGR04372 family)
MALSCMAAARYEDAAFNLQRIPESERNPTIDLLFTDALLRKGDVVQAFQALDAAYKKRPSAAGAQVRGDLALELGEGDHALTAYEQAAQFEPALLARYTGSSKVLPSTDVLRAMRLIDAYHRVGDSLLSRGRGHAMVPYYDKARTILAEISPQFWAESPHLQEFRNSLVLSPFWCERISHTAFLDGLLKSMYLGWRPATEIVLLSPRENTANTDYVAVWRRYLRIISDPAKILDLMPASVAAGETFSSSMELPGGKTAWWIDGAALAQERWEAEGRPPLLNVEHLPAISSENFRELGLPADAWFVCLHVRDSGFYQEGDHTAYAFRNGTLENFLPAMKAIVDAGGWVIRMGDHSMRPMAKMKQVIDYARHPLKSGALDVLLCASCKFFIGSTSGLYLVPSTYGIPCVLVDWASYCPRPWYGNHRFIPKIFYELSSNALVPYNTVFSESFRWNVYDGRSLTRTGIGTLDSAPTDILHVVEEMLADPRCKYSSNVAFDALCAGHNVIGKAHISDAFWNTRQDLFKSFPSTENKGQHAGR